MKFHVRTFGIAVALGLFAFASTDTAAASKEIRHQVVVASSVATAWRAWTTNDGLQAFFPGIRPGGTNVRLEPHGPYEFEFNPDRPYGSRGCDRCFILAYEPERMLSFAWDHRVNSPVRGQMTHVVVRFEALGPAETRVTLVVDGWGDGPHWDESYRFFDNAWRVVMEQFRAYLDGSNGADRPETRSEPQHTTQGRQGE